MAHFGRFPGGAEQNQVASFQWGNSAETALHFHAELHFHVEGQNWLSGAQNILSAAHQPWEQSRSRTVKLKKYKCWKQWNNLSTGSTPCCRYKSGRHLLQLSSVFFGAKSTTESTFYEHFPLLYWHRTMMPFFMFSHSAEEHYFLQHSITNITVINNSEQHEPLLRAPLGLSVWFCLI